MNYWIIVGIVNLIILTLVGVTIYKQAKDKELSSTVIVVGAITMSLLFEILIFVITFYFRQAVDGIFTSLSLDIPLGRRITALLVVGFGALLGLIASFYIIPLLKEK